MPGVHNGRRLRASCTLQRVTSSGYLRTFVKLCFGSWHMQASSQTEFPSLAGTHCFVCQFCGAVLPEYPLDSHRFSHCDPRPPQMGAFFTDLLANRRSVNESDHKQS